MKKVLLTEGGGPGHMAHPFDLEYVKTGQDLLNFFTEKVPEFLSRYPDAVHIKTDGINVSFKLVSKTNFYGEEEREFAVDRGSMYAIDREGITLDRIGEKWKPGHGMIPAITDLLTILNAALDSGAIDEEVKALGLVDNPEYFINTEYVKETEEKPVMNVIKYGEDFIAFHGINQFKFVESEKTKSISRSGKFVVPPTKSSAAALDSFTRKVKSFTRDYGVLGKEETKVGQKKGSSINFESALSEVVSICCSKDGKVMTDTLAGWLRNPKTINPFGPPKGAKIVLADGKSAFAISKQVYLSLIAGTDTISTSDLLGGMDEGKQQMAIDAVNGAIFNHATRQLGKAVLETLYAGFGGQSAAQHEGIVMWHKKGSKEIFNFPHAVKITGDFIVEGMGGAISQKMAKEEPTQVKADTKRKIAVFPGAFKPPHRGHMDVVEHFASVADQVVILISPLSRKTPAGKEINKSVSEKIWQIYIDAKGIGNKVSIGSSPYNSPVQASFEVLKGNVPDFVPQAGDLIIPVASDKPDKRGKPDYERFMKFHEGLPDMVPGVIPANIEEFFYKAPSEGALSASAFRAALDTGEGIEAFLPTSVSAQEVFEALGVELEPEVDETEIDEPEDSGAPPAIFMGEDLIRMVEGLMNEESPLARVAVKRRKAPPPPPKPKEKEEEKESIWKYFQRQAGEMDWGGIEPLEEMSSMGAGAVEGGGDPDKKSLIREEEPIPTQTLGKAGGGRMSDEEIYKSQQQFMQDRVLAPDVSTVFDSDQFDTEKAYEQSMEDERLGAAKDVGANIAVGGAELIPGAAGEAVGKASDAATTAGAREKLSKGDIKGAAESVLSYAPYFDTAKSFAKGLVGQSFSSRGAEHEEGTPQRTAFLIRKMAMLNPEGEALNNVDDDFMPHLVNNPDVAKIAAQKGWITKDLYKRVLAGQKVSENQIKNHEEPIVEEVLNYLLGRMEIL